jgi:beta-ureidopropionase / N-carbamoyl-L-amino-acid hydrolase
LIWMPIATNLNPVARLPKHCSNALPFSDPAPRNEPTLCNEPTLRNEPTQNKTPAKDRMRLSIDTLNQAMHSEALTMLDGSYEHSPWIAEAALKRRPFKTLNHLKQVMAGVVRASSTDQKLALLRAHPELAGKAMVSQSLTHESTDEQSRAGLTHCSPEEFEKLQSLNRRYNEKFGWPFILAVRGPRALGLSRAQIIEIFERRLGYQLEAEMAECLRNIHRIVEIRLNDKFGVEPVDGNLVWDWAEALAEHSEPDFKAKGQLATLYMTEAHRKVAAQLATWMKACGFDEVVVDPVGNLVGRYLGTDPARKLVMTGSHYDTVRNAGKYDGRLGILAPMVSVKRMSEQGRRWPFTLEVIGFAEEEGQRFKATFLGAEAIIGKFNPKYLALKDSAGVPMLDAIGAPQGQEALLANIKAQGRRREQVDGFIEIHIEQGPVLLEGDHPLGVVTSINGSVRLMVEILGVASHAGTTPMAIRKDAAMAACELGVYLEKRAASEPNLVGTMGMLMVPSGSINVVPGACQFSLDIRAPGDAQRDRAVNDVLSELQSICARRGLSYSVEETMRAAAAPSDAAWQVRWEQVVADLGFEVFRLPSGAGHDAMKMAELCPQAMLFVRCGNGGISHNPLETMTNDDADLCVQAFTRYLNLLS